MSSIIAALAVRGAHKTVQTAEAKLKQAVAQKGSDAGVELPNTGYYTPVIFSILGIAVTTLAQFEPILQQCRDMLPPLDKDGDFTLDDALAAGVATAFAEEIIVVCNYLVGPNPVEGIWLGAADDIKLRERGIDFVDGSVSGFAAIIGAAPDTETAVRIARELQEKNLFVFMLGNNSGVTFAEQLAEAGVQMGWDAHLVPFGRETSAIAYVMGFACRVALSFGGVQEGDTERMIAYITKRVPAFVLALGDIDEEKCANAACALKFGIPVITDLDVPAIKPASPDSFAQIVPNVSLDEIVRQGIEARGIKVHITEVPVPVSFSPAFEGERIRREDMQAEFGSQKTDGFEYVQMMESADEVEDGKIEITGPDFDDMEIGSTLPVAVVVKVFGRKMQKDFEPILERQIHRFFNEAQGVFHMGQRDIIWMRVSKAAYEAGFRLTHLGSILHAMFHAEYGSIIDKVQIRIITNPDEVAELYPSARESYRERDLRLANMTDDSVDTFYSCTLCQSFAPTHVCIITPERSGLCGAYNWLDGRAAHEITPTGPNQPVKIGACVDAKLGQWEGVNEFVYANTGKTIERMSAYSMIVDPMTSCGCFECISALLPSANGIMTVDRDFPDMTPCGMKFSTLAGSVGGGNVTPGFIGHSKFYIGSKKFISADGGIARMVWMPKALKEQLRDMINASALSAGLGENFIDKIADETIAQSEEEVVEFLTRVEHPALAMDSMF